MAGDAECAKIIISELVSFRQRCCRRYPTDDADNNNADDTADDATDDAAGDTSNDVRRGRREEEGTVDQREALLARDTLPVGSLR